MEKIAKIRNGGLFKKGQVVITNIKKNGEEGESKVYTISGKVKVEDMGDSHILHFTSVGGSSFGVTSKGTVSGRSYTKMQSIVVSSYEFVE